MLSDPVVVIKLEEQFESIEHIDLWTGGLAEATVPGPLCGPA
ncbi:MAG: hypothetical protein GF401_05930 [Chitinivibrionales bacterium]|nr:hypothetical protein [Chitinivibrionales bacterium]